MHNKFFLTHSYTRKKVRARWASRRASHTLRDPRALLTTLQSYSDGKLFGEKKVREEVRTDSIRSNDSLVIAIERMFIAYASPLDLRRPVWSSLSESERRSSVFSEAIERTRKGG